ncbi:hypothetical protein [Fictibacillus phosphorivorans]|uniref:hypothetical protein n=1 Tax=Fictibacillus phosphorivorans TaxID=1221500 RepID=UPI00203F8CED|nr:hypothetical protein [Fictibacillus phosphorivorans]MCM3718100.1 hypothetical protein [Fictibacillus phosphorivorans]MCM3775727.1 hypothetical protein [Fictibacillus phosphorivorans]
MIGNLRDFTIGVLASLFATFITTYAFHVIHLGEAFNFKEFLKIVINYKVLLYWILLLILLLLLRLFIRNRIDNLQAPYPMVMSIGNNYDLEFEGEGYGFKWRIYADAKRKDPFTNEILDINVGRVDGPYCKNDYRKMKVSRTYLGRYKYNVLNVDIKEPY